MAANDRNIIMENVKIVNRNFAGKEGMYNREGDRNFNVLLDDDAAETFTRDGWNVKWFKVREEGDTPQAFLGVSVNFRGRPPRIEMITSRGRTQLSEEEVELLDFADITNVDLIVRPYEWSVRGETGIKAYLQALYVTIQEDALQLKYADVDQVPSHGRRVAHRAEDEHEDD